MAGEGAGRCRGVVRDGGAVGAVRVRRCGRGVGERVLTAAGRRAVGLGADALLHRGGQ